MLRGFVVGEFFSYFGCYRYCKIVERLLRISYVFEFGLISCRKDKKREN